MGFNHFFEGKAFYVEAWEGMFTKKGKDSWQKVWIAGQIVLFVIGTPNTIGIYFLIVHSIVVWRKLNMLTTLKSLMVAPKGFQDVFVQMWQRLGTSQLITFAITTWSLWWKQNLKLWEDKTKNVEHLIVRVQGVLCALKHARHTHTNDRTQHQHVQFVYWQPPPTNYVKWSIDATLFATRRKGMHRPISSWRGRHIHCCY